VRSADRIPVLIVDYGMGNLRSVEKAIESVGGNPEISDDPERVLKAPRLILPGVGAFGDAMTNLRQKGLGVAIVQAAGAGTPLLGLCLGLQLLFSESQEFGRHPGLNLIPGKVRKFDQSGLRVPHVGWNQVEAMRDDPVFAGIAEGSFFYFVHSYFVEPEDESDVLCRTSYGHDFCSVARRSNVFGVQFHPEKSQDAGRRLLGNFLEL
jgi:glutamine amidotransferase